HYRGEKTDRMPCEEDARRREQEQGRQAQCRSPVRLREQIVRNGGDRGRSVHLARSASPASPIGIAVKRASLPSKASLHTRARACTSTRSDDARASGPVIKGSIFAIAPASASRKRTRSRRPAFSTAARACRGAAPPRREDRSAYSASDVRDSRSGWARSLSRAKSPVAPKRCGIQLER